MAGKSQLAADSLAWLGNVSTSVAIIFVNKVLMNVSGFGFRYGARPLASAPKPLSSAKRRTPQTHLPSLRTMRSMNSCLMMPAESIGTKAAATVLTICK